MPATDDHTLLRDALVVGAVLLTLGTVGLVTRRSVIHAALSIGTMAAGVALTLAGCGAFHRQEWGEVFGVVTLLWCATPAVLLAALVLRRERRPADVEVEVEVAQLDAGEAP
ncbi:MAG: NADH-quinone oxidoreductase subunit K [Planctomycetales bacterium]